VIVLDASVLIAHFESTDAHHNRATELLVEAAGEELGASPLTLAEVLVGPARTGNLDAARAAIRELEIASIALADNAPERLAELRASTRLRLSDCCVLLAAETAGGAEVATFDVRLAAATADFGLPVRK
jgi:predicted nucleic acid-binding protein